MASRFRHTKRALADAIVRADSGGIRNLRREDLELLLSYGSAGRQLGLLIPNREDTLSWPEHSPADRLSPQLEQFRVK